MTYRPCRMLVTGAAGFIGANFVHHMLAADERLEITSLDRLTYAGSRDNLGGLSDPARHRFVRGDIADAEAVESLLRTHAIDTVVHFAAESHVDRSIAGPAAVAATNVLGTITLLETCRRVWRETCGLDPLRCRFHHISTDEVFGSLEVGEAAWDETAAYRPNSPYSASKAAGDHFVRAFHRTYALPVTLSLCSNNYGPRQHAEKFIPTVIRTALAGEPIPIYGDGSNARDWLYVDDHCRGIAAALAKGRVGEAYAFGGGEEWRNLDLVGEICRRLDDAVPAGSPHARLITFVDDRPGHDRRYALNTGKAERVLGWCPRVAFATGIARTLDWYLSRLAQAA